MSLFFQVTIIFALFNLVVSSVHKANIQTLIILWCLDLCIFYRKCFAKSHNRFEIQIFNIIKLSKL